MSKLVLFNLENFKDLADAEESNATYSTDLTYSKDDITVMSDLLDAIKVTAEMLYGNSSSVGIYIVDGEETIALTDIVYPPEKEMRECFDESSRHEREPLL